ncbi:4Fe-4S binding protein [Clostridium bovifaecis]|uniref:4Fe-4S binding protein n=1 Tax=Clostridium bovifaecis TaxID=2184719 RepID=A0A6I6F0T6_9CLOT|nr:4Fe-4S binding protein [Clostridium bovifaecis]
MILKFWKKYSYMLLFAFVVAGLFDLRIALAAIVCMLAPIGFALVGKGRFWCGNICPRGNFYDNIIGKISRHKSVPRILKSPIFRFAVITFMFYMFGTGLAKSWGSLADMGMVFYRIIVITTVVGIALSPFYHERTWCNFCPMGSISAFISSFKKDKKVLKVSSACVSCKLCQKKCPMGIVPYDYKGDVLSHPDCIQCSKCVNVCPKDAIGY